MADGGAPRITYGSVCSGIEAASVAWHPLGWQAAWLAEIEPFPSAVLAHHYPDVPNLGDMQAIATRVLRGSAPAPDVLVGGTPCQAFSVAGLRESLADERGNLTLKFVELADAIDHVRRARGDDEAIIVWENVPGVLSTKDNAFGCFLAGLAGEDGPLQSPRLRWPDAGCVYGPARAIAWRTLDAQYFGLAQRRRRVFVVASARNRFDPAQVLFEWEGVRRDTPPRREAWQDTPATLTASAGHHGHSGDGSANLIAETLRGHPRPGSDSLGAIAFGGNTSAPINVAMTLNAGGTGRLDFESETLIAFDTTQITSSANVSNPRPGDPCHPLAASAHPPAIAFDCKASGRNGFGVGDVAPTLRAMGHADTHQNGGGMLAACSTSGVRRLTPIECERLQGFPDGYTAIEWDGWRKMDAVETPDSCRAAGFEVRQAKKSGRWYVKDVDGPRYKALGNSMAVPVMQWIGRRIEMALLRDRA